MNDHPRPEDFGKICRICLKNPNNTISITLYNIVYMIQACSSVRILQDDNLPNQICPTCFINLKNAFSFRQQCEKSDKELRKQIGKNKLEISEEIDISEEGVDVNENGGCDQESDCDVENDEKVEQKIKVNNSNKQEIKIKIQEEVDISENDEGKKIWGVLESGERDEESDCEVENIVKNIEKDEQKIKISNSNENEIVLVKINKPSVSDNTIKITNLGKSRSNRKRIIVPCTLPLYKYACDDCPCRFEFAHHLGQHMRNYHFAKPLKCNNCFKEFYHPIHLEEHNQNVHESKTFKCDICPKTYRRIHGLKAHKSFVHMGQSPYSCTECTLKCSSKPVLERHLFDVHKLGKNPRVLLTCKICNKTLNRQAFKKHNLTHMTNRPKNICEICNKNFSFKGVLEEHIKNIHKKQLKYKYSCPVCNKKLLRPSLLKVHMVTHTGEKAYTCEKCNKRFARKTNLKTHIARTHLNLRKFKCQICTQNFFDRTSLRNHLRTHTGEKPFQCLVCDKNFSFQSALITHNKNVHKNK